MEDGAITQQIKYNKENIEKALQKYEVLAEKYGADHDETIKQRQQIDELCKNFDILFQRIGKNGWSADVYKGIKELQKTVIDLQQKDSVRTMEIKRLNEKLDEIKLMTVELKNRPKNLLYRLKDIAYLIIATITIMTYFGSIPPW
jgi:uncharacterized protein involved in exopolysaccharide biosynthesis